MMIIMCMIIVIMIVMMIMMICIIVDFMGNMFTKYLSRKLMTVLFKTVAIQEDTHYCKLKDLQLKFLSMFIHL